MCVGGATAIDRGLPRLGMFTPRIQLRGNSGFRVSNVLPGENDTLVQGKGVHKNVGKRKKMEGFGTLQAFSILGIRYLSCEFLRRLFILVLSLGLEY